MKGNKQIIARWEILCGAALLAGLIACGATSPGGGTTGDVSQSQLVNVGGPVGGSGGGITGGGGGNQAATTTTYDVGAQGPGWGVKPDEGLYVEIKLQGEVQSQKAEQGENYQTVWVNLFGTAIQKHYRDNTVFSPFADNRILCVMDWTRNLYLETRLFTKGDQVSSFGFPIEVPSDKFAQGLYNPDLGLKEDLTFYVKGENYTPADTGQWHSCVPEKMFLGSVAPANPVEAPAEITSVSSQFIGGGVNQLLSMGQTTVQIQQEKPEIIAPPFDDRHLKTELHQEYNSHVFGPPVIYMGTRCGCYN